MAKHRKTHLCWKAKGLRHEPTYYGAGNELVTFPVKGHKSGVMICYDGKLLAEIWDEPGIIYATVDPSSVSASRDDNPWYRGRRSDLY